MGAKLTIVEEKTDLDDRLEELFQRKSVTALVEVEAGNRIYTLDRQNDDANEERASEVLKQIKVLGNTKSGHTFLVENEDGEKEVLKLLSYRCPPGDGTVEQAKSLELFEREIAVVSKLNHPQIAEIKRSFTTDSHGETSFYFTQDYFAGENLEEMVAKGGPLKPRRAARIVMSLLDAVEYCHSRNVFHRDIKPANIILSEEEAKLVDFGRVVEGKVSTAGGSTIAGTPGYMAPEQWWGKASEKSDIYGIGTTLLHLVTGEDPENMLNENAGSFEERFKLDYEEKIADLDEKLKEIFANCLAFDQEERYSSVPELRKDLQGYLSQVDNLSESDESDYEEEEKGGGGQEEERKQRGGRNLILGAVYGSIFALFSGLFLVDLWPRLHDGDALEHTVMEDYAGNVFTTDCDFLPHLHPETIKEYHDYPWYPEITAETSVTVDGVDDSKLVYPILFELEMEVEDALKLHRLYGKAEGNLTGIERVEKMVEDELNVAIPEILTSYGSHIVREGSNSYLVEQKVKERLRDKINPSVLSVKDFRYSVGTPKTVKE